MGIIRLVLKIVAFIITVIFIVNFFWPDWVQAKKEDLFERMGLTEDSRILGLSTADMKQIALTNTVKFVQNLPVVQKTKQWAVNEYQRQMNNLTNRSKTEVNKV